MLLLFDDNKVKMARKQGKIKRKEEKGTEKRRRKPPVFEFGGEVTLVRLALYSQERNVLTR